MVVTLNEAMTIFHMTSSNFTGTNQSVSLEFNSCGGTASTTNISVGASSYDLTSATAYTDSVYSFTLTITSSTGEIITEQACYFIGEEMKCDAVAWYKTAEIEKSLYYQALVASNSCISCSCTDLCSLFNTLTETPCDDFKCTTCSTCN